MFSKTALVTFASSAILAAALPNEFTTLSQCSDTGPDKCCNTGPVQCCESVQSSSSLDAAVLLDFYGVVLQDDNVPIGLNCKPFHEPGILPGSGAFPGVVCDTFPLCCENDDFNGVIAIDCTPLSL
ncbi:hypothetical protein M422DRAFT_247831 [Sphaerobolus stellatus SS14]|nr:hypothetical protein M422DRAFT_247831 [Sphaerobolus stellatus SS14]